MKLWERIILWVIPFICGITVCLLTMSTEKAIFICPIIGFGSGFLSSYLLEEFSNKKEI